MQRVDRLNGDDVADELPYDDHPPGEAIGHRWIGTARRRAVVSSLALNTAAVIVLLAACSSSFMVNDDSAMASFASGSYTGHPSSHLVFIGMIPGVVLAFLYRVLPSAPWYGLMLLVAQVCCLTVVSTITWLRRNTLGTTRCCLILALVGAYLPGLTLTPTFTVTASIVASTGLLALLAAGATTSMGGPHRTLIGVVCVCAIAAASIRWESMLGIVAVFAPILVAVAWRLRWRRAILFAVGGLLLLGSVHGLDIVWADRGGWAAYNAYNDVRGQLHGTQQMASALSSLESPEMQAMLRDNEWTPDDLNLFTLWFFDDPEVFSKAHLTRLLDVTQSTEFAAPPSDAVGELVSGRGNLMVLLFASFGIGLIRLRGRYAVLLAIQLVWSLGVLVATAALLRMPDRVALPSLFALSAILAIGIPLLAPDSVREFTRTRGSLATCGQIGFIGTIALFTVGSVWADRGPFVLSDANSEGHQRLRAQVQELSRVDPNGRFIAVGAALDSASLDPLRSASATVSSRLLELGWPTFSPHFEQRKRQLGIDGDPLLALIEQTDLYLVTPPGTIPTFQSTYRRRFGLIVEAVEVGNLGNGEAIFTLRQATMPADVEIE